VDCLHCGKKINALRKLHDGEFCSAAHRKAYLKKQNEDAVNFLAQNRPRRRRKPEVAETVAAPAPPAILVEAEFLSASVAPQRPNQAPWRNAQPVCSPSHISLPPLICIPAPSPCASRFIEMMTLEGRVEQGNAKPVLMHPVEFAVRTPVIRVAVTRPVWMEPLKPATSERPSAAFVRFQPAWARAGHRPACTPTTVPFVAEPALIAVDITPAALALRLARPVHSSITVAWACAVCTWVRLGRRSRRTSVASA
jgi:hypothetical protein